MKRTEQSYPLSDEWLMDYAAGTLPCAYAAVAETYLSMIEDGESALAPYNACGGDMLEDLSPATEKLSVGVDELLARMDDAPASDEGEAAEWPAYIPEGLRASLPTKDGKINWTYLGPGLRKALLRRDDDDTRLWLIKAKPGVKIPHHSHNGSELTLILKGGFKDGDQHFVVGDVEEADEEVGHTIEIDTGEECVCLAATKGPLVFYSPQIRFFQRFIGM